MGQSEVIELLEKQEMPLSARQISDMLNDDYCKVSKDINKMLQYREVECLEINKDEAMIRFKCKRRMRLFYVKKK